MLRQTKIVATLGPASSSPEVLERMIRAGVDVVRLNFSHGTAADHIERARLVREVARARRQGGGRDGRPAGAEDPRRQVRAGQGDARGGQALRARRRAQRARQRRARGAGLQGAAARREARRHPAAERRADRAGRGVGARRGGAHDRAASAASCRTTRASTSRAAASRRRRSPARTWRTSRPR